MIMSKLYYVIGSSGAGKDSLINYIRERVAMDTAVGFAQRYITRPADAGGEAHISLSTEEFLRRQQRGYFVMNWFSHETHYGVGEEINTWLSNGLDVVVNGSREYLQEATQRYTNLVPVLISVNPDILCERLFSRGRENSEQIKTRLIQAIRLENEITHTQLIIIENNGRLHDAGEQLLKAITAHNVETCD